MKLYNFEKDNYKAKTISELLDIAEVSGGRVMFLDELGQIWNLEKTVEVCTESSPTKETEET